MNANDITFGVEIEGTIKGQDRMAIGSYHRGEHVAHTGGKFGLKAFKAEHDSSIRPEMDRRDCELISPVMQGETGLYHLVAALENMVLEHDFQVNDRCGIHVHIGAQDLDRDQIARIVNAFRLYEKAFFALNGEKFYRRWDGHYCKPSERWVSLYNDRYQSLNLTNVGRSSKNTIEFRVWQGSIDYMHAITAVSMAVALVVRFADDDAFDTYQGQIVDVQDAVDRFCADVFCELGAIIPITDEKDDSIVYEDPSDYIDFLIAQAAKVPSTR